MELTLEEIDRAVEDFGVRHFNELSPEDQETLVDWMEQRAHQSRDDAEAAKWRAIRGESADA